MGNSFKLQKDGGSNKEQAVQVGVLMFLLGIMGGVFFHEIGFVIALIGLIIAIGGKFASE